MNVAYKPKTRSVWPVTGFIDHLALLSHRPPLIPDLDNLLCISGAGPLHGLEDTTHFPGPSSGGGGGKIVALSPKWRQTTPNFGKTDAIPFCCGF